MTTQMVNEVVKAVVEQRKIVNDLRRAVFREGLDYGVVPSSSKPTLLKPGAEKIISALQLYPRVTVLSLVEDWESGFFFYRYQIELVHRETGSVYGVGIGSCNSREMKYGYRWVPREQIPPGLKPDDLETRSSVISEFAFAIEKSETSGPYGKPAQYWEDFKAAIENGRAKKIERKTKSGKFMDAYEIETILYRVPNSDIYSLVNTIDKMAYKRALVAAALIAGCVSDEFTQDIEDESKFDIIDAEYHLVTEDLDEEREVIMRVLIPNFFEDANAIASRIQTMGYSSYENMRQSLTFAQTLKSLSAYGQPAK